MVVVCEVYSSRPLESAWPLAARRVKLPATTTSAPSSKSVGTGFTRPAAIWAGCAAVGWRPERAALRAASISCWKVAYPVTIIILAGSRSVRLSEM